MGLADNLRRGTALLDAIGAIVEEFVSPDTPDNRQACVNGIARVCEGFGYVEQGHRWATYITDAVAAAAGGQDSAGRVLADIDAYFGGQAPKLIHDLAATFLGDAEQSILEYRGGKPLPG